MGLTAISISLRGYSLIGKTAILHIVILGSSPNISNVKLKSQILYLPYFFTAKKTVKSLTMSIESTLFSALKTVEVKLVEVKLVDV